MNKIKLNVVKEEKIDNRVNNTGRPVNTKSARQIRLAKQALYAKLNNAFVSGKKFKINNDSTGEYMYVGGDNNTGSIVSALHGSYVCNINYIGRTKVQGFTYVLGRYINVTINLKEVTFVK
jgi:hypothetical protein